MEGKKAMINLKRVLFLLVILSVGLFLWMDQEQNKMRDGAATRAALPQVGHPAPDFILPDMTEAEEIGLAEIIQEGQGAIVYFWTSWCPFCAASMKALEEAHKDYGENIHFLGINVTSQDSVSAAEKFTDKHGITFRNLMDVEGSVSKAYYVPPVPTALFINSEGIIIHRKVGALTTQELERTIKQFGGSN